MPMEHSDNSSHKNSVYLPIDSPYFDFALKRKLQIHLNPAYPITVEIPTIRLPRPEFPSPGEHIDSYKTAPHLINCTTARRSLC